MNELISALAGLITAISTLIATLKSRESRRRKRIIERAYADPLLRSRLERMLEDGTLDDREVDELKRLIKPE